MADRAHALGCSGLAPVQFTTIYSPACLGSEIATLAHADQVRPGKARGEHFLSAVPPRAVVAAPRQHLRSGPCMDGSGLSREVGALQRWSVQPCVRPFDAAHMAAGHNAFRRSGPGQFLALCDALAPYRASAFPLAAAATLEQRRSTVTGLERIASSPPVRIRRRGYPLTTI